MLFLASVPSAMVGWTWRHQNIVYIEQQLNIVNEKPYVGGLEIGLEEDTNSLLRQHWPKSTGLQKSVKFRSLRYNSKA
jgi:hypothetical protein